jgi:hypothetical protein
MRRLYIITFFAAHAIAYAATPAAKPSANPAVKPEAKPQPKVEVKGEPKVEAKAAQKSEAGKGNVKVENLGSSNALLDKPENFSAGNSSTLDGIPVQAVENYRNPYRNQFSFAMGYYPLNPYYTGYAPGIAYTLFYSRSLAWDVIDASFVFAVDKGLTSELADKYQVNPKEINRLKFTAFSQAAYFFAYGKTVISSSFIRYFRSAVLLGAGLASHTKSQKVGISYGIRLESYANDSFSFKAELKNISTLTNGFENHAAIILGTTYSF